MRNLESDFSVLSIFTYTYDAVGNRTSMTFDGTSYTYTYDNNDKLTKIGTTSGGSDLATFGYDSNGNMTGVSGTLFGSKTLVYNDDNRLTSLTYGGVTDLYYYTYTGLRHRARLGGTYGRYLYNGERVLEELNDSGTMQARYTTENGSYYGQLLHLYRPSGSVSRYPLYDSIGTARMLVNDSATVTDTYHLDAWGQQIGSTGSTPNPYRFGGAWGYITDPSGMLQLGARYYWPEVGRFISQDPIGEGNNWYAYVANNPLVYADPRGELSFGDIGRAARRAACAVGRAARAIGRAAGAALDAVNPFGAAKGFAKACPPAARTGQTKYCQNLALRMDARISEVGSPGAARHDPEYQRMLQLYNQRCRTAPAANGLLPLCEQ